jgi:hypothetical protein
MPTKTAMSADVCVEGYAQTVEYYGTDDIQGVQCAPLEEEPPEATIVNTTFPDYIVDEMFEPGVFWFQTGPPTSLDDETGQTRGQTCLPDYLEPDDQLDPSDVDWQHDTGSYEAACTFPTLNNHIIAYSPGGGATTHTVTIPTGAVGDMIVIGASFQNGGGLPALPEGWNIIRYAIATAPATDVTFFLIYKIADGTETSFTVTSGVAIESVLAALRIANADPFTGPAYGADETSGGDDPPNFTPLWSDIQKALWIPFAAYANNAGTDTFTAPPTNHRQFTIDGTGGTGTFPHLVMGGRYLEAASNNPGTFVWGSGPTVSGVAGQIVVRGFCADNLNDDPAGTSIPVELELEAEVDCYGWQSQGPGDDPNVVFDDPDTGHTSVPDWLEPDAEPNPDDVTFGWQRQSLVEEDYETGGAWTAVTEAQEDVFDYAIDWQQGIAPVQTDGPLDVDDETTISVCWPEWLEPEAEFDPSDQDWQHKDQPDEDECLAPVVVEQLSARDASDSRFHVVTLPSGLTSLDRIVVILGGDPSAAPATPSGWTQFGSDTDSGDSLTAYYRDCDGTEGATETFLGAATVPEDVAAVWFVLRFRGWDAAYAPEFASTFGSNANPNPPSISPTWGAEATTYIAAFMAGRPTPETVSAYPSNSPLYRDYEAGSGFNNTSYGAIAGASNSTGTFDPGSFTITASDTWLTATIAVKGQCRFDTPVSMEAPAYLNDPAEDEPTPEGWQRWPLDNEPGASFDIVGASIPAELEPEAEVDTEGWRCAPLQDLPLNDDISDTSVPVDLEPEAEVDTNGWFSVPLHDTPSTDDITETSIPAALEPDDQVDSDGWAFRLPDMERPVDPPVDPGVAVGTLPGHVAGKRWWLEREVKTEKAKRARGEGRWPNLPEPKQAPPWKPVVVTKSTTRPRLEQINRDWKIKLRKAREQDDLIIAAIIAALLAERNDDPD